MDPRQLEEIRRWNPEGCFVARQGERVIACITSHRYGPVGWWGNLVVDPGFRGRGTGRLLVEAVSDRFKDLGVASICAMARPATAPLYVNLGFSRGPRFTGLVGLVAPLAPRNHRATPGCDSPAAPSKCSLPALDAAGMAALDTRLWGMDRTRLLSGLALTRSRVTAGNSGFLMYQHLEDDYTFIGPWEVLDGEPLATWFLWQEFRHVLPGPRRVFFLTPSSNTVTTELARIIRLKAFEEQFLLYQGDPPRLDQQGIMALASSGAAG